MIRSIYGQKRRDAFDASLRFLGVQYNKAAKSGNRKPSSGYCRYCYLSDTVYIFRLPVDRFHLGKTIGINVFSGPEKALPIGSLCQKIQKERSRTPDIA